MVKLRDRFSSLWQRHTIVEGKDVSSDVFKYLSEKYQEPWRTYHNLNHILECLHHFDACKDHAQFADSIEFAIWFHDCIYEVGHTDNEVRSRDWFLEQSDGHLVSGLRTVVAKLIMDTSRRSVPDTSDGQLLADIDLTSFGLPWPAYMKDSMAVQSELKPDNDTDSGSGRIEFLKSLTAKGNVYYSNYYLDHYEEAAKENIQKHIKFLSG